MSDSESETDTENTDEVMPIAPADVAKDFSAIEFRLVKNELRNPIYEHFLVGFKFNKKTVQRKCIKCQSILVCRNHTFHQIMCMNAYQSIVGNFIVTCGVNFPKKKGLSFPGTITRTTLVT